MDTTRPVTADRIRATRLDTTGIRTDWPDADRTVGLAGPTIEQVQAQGLALRAALAACAGVEAVAK